MSADKNKGRHQMNVGGAPFEGGKTLRLFHIKLTDRQAFFLKLNLLVDIGHVDFIEENATEIKGGFFLIDLSSAVLWSSYNHASFIGS
jgi:hypothetical protein